MQAWTLLVVFVISVLASAQMGHSEYKTFEKVRLSQDQSDILKFDLEEMSDITISSEDEFGTTLHGEDQEIVALEENFMSSPDIAFIHTEVNEFTCCECQCQLL